MTRTSMSNAQLRRTAVEFTKQGAKPSIDESTGEFILPCEGFQICFRQHGGPQIDQQKLFKKTEDEVVRYFQRWVESKLTRQPDTWRIVYVGPEETGSDSPAAVPISMKATCCKGHPVCQRFLYGALGEQA